MVFASNSYILGPAARVGNQIQERLSLFNQFETGVNLPAPKFLQEAQLFIKQRWKFRVGNVAQAFIFMQATQDDIAELDQ